MNESRKTLRITGVGCSCGWRAEALLDSNYAGTVKFADEAFPLMVELVAELKAARAENERLRAAMAVMW